MHLVSTGSPPGKFIIYCTSSPPDAGQFATHQVRCIITKNILIIIYLLCLQISLMHEFLVTRYCFIYLKTANIYYEKTLNLKIIKAIMKCVDLQYRSFTFQYSISWCRWRDIYNYLPAVFVDHFSICYSSQWYNLDSVR